MKLWSGSRLPHEGAEHTALAAPAPGLGPQLNQEPQGWASPSPEVEKRAQVYSPRRNKQERNGQSRRKTGFQYNDCQATEGGHPCGTGNKGDEPHPGSRFLRRPCPALRMGTRVGAGELPEPRGQRDGPAEDTGTRALRSRWPDTTQLPLHFR